MALDSYYRICVELRDQNYYGRSNIFMGLKVYSNNMDEPNIKEAIKNADIDPLKNLLEKVGTKSEKFTKDQQNDIASEDNFAMMTLDKVHLFYTFVIIQTILSIILGLYQVFSFRKKILTVFY